jgi:hypothetical protein
MRLTCMYGIIIMKQYKILRPALLSDYPATSFPQQTMIVGHMNEPCPILVELPHRKTIWQYPNTHFHIDNEIYKIAPEDLKTIPCVGEWISSYMYLDGEEQKMAKENKFEWQFIFTIYNYSKRCERENIIKPFWSISQKLQIALNMFEKCQTKEQYAQVMQHFSELDNDLNGSIYRNPPKKLSQLDCDNLQVGVFIRIYRDECVNKIL